MNRLWNLTDYIKRLSHPSHLVRQWAFTAIKEYHPREFIREVSCLIGDPDQHLACAAPKYLARHHATEFAPAILECFKTSSGVVAANCIEALKHMKYEKGGDTVLEKLPDIHDPDEILAVLDYLGIIKTWKSHQILLDAITQFKKDPLYNYFIGTFANSLFAHGNPDDIEWVIAILLRENLAGMGLDKLFRSIADAASAYKLYKDIANIDGQKDILETPMEVFKNVYEVHPTLGLLTGVSDKIADQIKGKQYGDLISSLMFESKRIVQARYPMDPIPDYLEEINAYDKKAIQILEIFSKTPGVSQEIRKKSPKGRNFLSMVIAAWFSMIRRGDFIDALSPDASTTDLINSLKKADVDFPESIIHRLRDIAPIQDLKTALTEKLDTWGDISAVKVMGEIGSPEFIPDLIRIINETESLDFIYNDAISALKCIDESGHPELLSAIKERRLSDPVVAMDVLSSLPYPEAHDLAYKIWNGDNEEYASDYFEGYALTLTGIGDVRGIDAIREIMFEGNILYVGKCLETLCYLNEKDIPELEMIHEKQEEQRKHQEKRLKKLGELSKGVDSRNLPDDWPDPLRSAAMPIKRDQPKVGRNDPCPCGSGKKYKKCCLEK